MKLKELIEKIDKSSKNEAYINLEDIIEDAFGCFVDYEKVNNQTSLKAYWINVKYEGGGHYGTKLYFLNDEPIAISVQHSHKHTEALGYFNKESFDKLKLFIMQFVNEEYIPIDLDTDINEYYKLEFNSQYIEEIHKPFYNGKPVEIVERIKSEELGGILSNEVIILVDNNTMKIKRIKIDELDFKVNTYE